MIERRAQVVCDKFPFVEERIARFSKCEKYRYYLLIRWDKAKPLIQFIGLNPSTADEKADDNTVTRVKTFARDWGYGGVIMTNLFGWRDTDKEAMKKVQNPIGEAVHSVTQCGHVFQNANDRALFLAAMESAVCIAAWGNDGRHLYRGTKIRQWFPKPLFCLRITKRGMPEHPLYLRSTLTPIPLPA